ncbi:MAG: 16S rRNA (cytosine(967)-C(5))-methyltransferase RsmB [Steroidobacteraceae bacterium]
MSSAGWQLASAAEACAAVIAGRSADDALEPFATHEQGAAVRAIALGTLRWHFRLQGLLKQLLSRDQKLQLPIVALLEVALHQLEYSQHRPELSVNAAVEATRLMRQARAAGLVNALLRRYLRERDAVQAGLKRNPAAVSAHPGWLYEALRAAWPRQAEQLLAANNEPAPMVLRVALDRVTRAACLEALNAAGIGAQAIEWLPAAVRLERAVPVTGLPLFAEGAVSVQDAGAQLAAVLVDAKPGQRVLDACAAPGGKSGALLEQAGGALQLTAVDAQPERVALIAANLQRLGRTAQVHCADLAREPRWWDGRPFDRILLDAPCSATGVIRRHPDIRILRRSGDIKPLAAIQRAILQRCFEMLAPGGRLIYCTCSVLPQENDGVIERFLEEQPLAQSARLAAPDTAVERTVHGLQLLPGDKAPSDGFYYACLQRR